VFLGRQGGAYGRAGGSAYGRTSGLSGPSGLSGCRLRPVAQAPGGYVGLAESGVENLMRCLSLFSQCLFGEISVFVFSCGRAQGT